MAKRTHPKKVGKTRRVAHGRGGAVFILTVLCPAALALAHLARAAAASFALTAGLLRRSLFLGASGAASPAFILAHLALVPAIMAARPAALKRFLRLFTGAPLALAHLALAAAAILARPAADMRRLPASLTGTDVWADVSMPSLAMDSISLWSVSICSLIAMIRLS